MPAATSRRLLAILALTLTTAACTPDDAAPAAGTGSEPTTAPTAAAAAAQPDTAAAPAPGDATAAAPAGTAQATPDATVVALVSNFKPPEKGDPEALVTIYEFSDYICPYCRNFNQDTAGKVDENYVKTGKARYVHWDFPLAGHGWGAIVSAEASHCAADQGKYWEMHKALFDAWEAQSKLDVKDEQAAVASVLGIASKIVADQEAFKACVNTQKYRPVVATMYRQATDMGLDATPAFVIQHKDPADPTGKDQIKVVLGALDYEEFAKTVDIEIFRAQGTPIADTPTPTPDAKATATAEALMKTATAEATRAAKTPTAAAKP